MGDRTSDKPAKPPRKPPARRPAPKPSQRKAAPPAVKPVAVAAPPAQRSDFLVSGGSDADLNCKAALLFPANAPLTDQAVAGPDRRAIKVAPRKDKSESSTLDLQAVWAHVTNPPDAKGAALMVFLHGFYTFVTIDAAGQCAWPSWADTDFDAKTDPKGIGPKCATAGYGVVQSAKCYRGSLITLAPENARPYVWKKEQVGKPTEYHGTIAAKAIFNQVGEFSKPDRLGKLIDECLQRLTKVKPATGRLACAAAALASVPNVNRLFLAGHSGAHSGLYACARSDVAKQKPADLLLLDCFYANGTDAVQEFADRAPGGLGNGPGQSRVLLVHDPGSYRSSAVFNSMRSALQKRYKGKVADVQFTPGKTTAENVRNALAPTRAALSQFPIVIVSGGLGHFTIPADFMPLVLETAP